MALPLLPGFDAVIAQYRDVIDRSWPPGREATGSVPLHLLD